jgi:hypothetical protein
MQASSVAMTMIGKSATISSKSAMSNQSTINNQQSQISAA